MDVVEITASPLRIMECISVLPVGAFHLSNWPTNCVDVSYSFSVFVLFRRCDIRYQSVCLTPIITSEPVGRYVMKCGLNIMSIKVIPRACY
jgi:hypothetical protein